MEPAARAQPKERRIEILIACDKFRGSLTAREANAAILEGLTSSGLAAEARALPIADGGEGTIDALEGHAMTRRHARVAGAFGEPVEADYLYDAEQRAAVIEMAAVAGHAATHGKGYDPDRATSRGVGELIAAALDDGARHVTVAVGGSVTVDGGAGALMALGARYLDDAGEVIEVPAGRTLARIASVDLSQLDPRTDRLAIVLAADVDNPLVGPNGAAAVFGPQKGVASEDVPGYDAALAHFDALLSEATGAEPLANAPFAGAAGGMLVGLRAAATTTARDGFAVVAQHHQLEEAIAACDLVITGEGSLDAQSLSGKGPIAIARMAQAARRPAIAFAGRVAVDPATLAEHGLVAFAILRTPVGLRDALASGATNLTATAESAFRLIGSFRGPSSRTDRP